MTKGIIGLVAVVAIAVAVYTQLTIFVVQPLGLAPEGATIIMLRLTSLEFIDSADAFCEREMGGVNLICRAGVLGRIGQQSTVLMRLPYSETLYGISTGGQHYDR